MKKDDNWPWTGAGDLKTVSGFVGSNLVISNMTATGIVSGRLHMQYLNGSTSGMWTYWNSVYILEDIGSAAGFTYSPESIYVAYSSFSNI